VATYQRCDVCGAEIATPAERVFLPHQPQKRRITSTVIVLPDPGYTRTFDLPADLCQRCTDAFAMAFDEMLASLVPLKIPA
jgi:hypothetical protein